MLIPILAALLILVLAAGIALGLKLRNVASNLDLAKKSNLALTERLNGIPDMDAEKARLEAELTHLREQAKQWVIAFNAQKARAENDAGAKHQAAMGQLEAQRKLAEDGLSKLRSQIGVLQREFSVLDEESNLQEFGFYPLAARLNDTILGSKKQLSR